MLSGPKPRITGDRKAFIGDLEEAVYASKLISYTQGYMLMRAAAKEYGWNLNYGGIALMWRGGCIIRSVFLGKIKEAFDRNPELTNLLLDPYFKKQIEAAQAAWRRVVAKAVQKGIPVPAMSSALPSSTATAANRCPRICSRRSAIISARTPTSAWTSRAASTSTRTGPATAAT